MPNTTRVYLIHRTDGNGKMEPVVTAGPSRAEVERDMRQPHVRIDSIEHLGQLPVTVDVDERYGPYYDTPQKTFMRGDAGYDYLSQRFRLATDKAVEPFLDENE
nr:hypothetical protein [uncultured Pseudomonas sp.]